MENNKVFLYINRINSLLFLVGLIFAIGIMLFILSGMNSSNNRRSVEVEVTDKESNRKEVIELSKVNSVSGHDVHVIEAHSRKDGLLKSGGYSRSTRNILFLDRKGDHPTWLFDNNSNVIITNRQLMRKAEEKYITDYFYYEVARNDTNGDGRVSSDDRIDIGFSNPDGSDYHVLVGEVERVLDYEYFMKDKSLGLLLQIGNDVVYRIYSLKTKLLITEKQVTKVVSR